VSYPLLALDVAAGAAAATLLLDDERALYAEGDTAVPHSQGILPLLQGLLDEANLAWRDLAMLAYGRGPGSFTGLRIAAATLSGINASLKLPILHLSSLAVSALQSDAADIWVLEDARAGEAFVGHYRKGEAMQADACLAWSEVAALQPAPFVAHSEPAIALPNWQRRPLAVGRPEALAAVVRQELQHHDSATLPRQAEPAYLQLSQAERHMQHG